MHNGVDNNLITGKAHFRAVEVKILASENNQTQIKFEDQSDIRYARVVAMETYFQTDLRRSQPSNYLVIDGVQASYCSVILETNDADDTGHFLLNPETGEPQFKDGKKIWVPSKSAQGNGRFTSTQQNQKYLPLTALHRIQNAGSSASSIVGPDPFTRQLQTFYNMYVSWDKCILQIANGGLNNSVNQAVVLGVYYSWLDINGKRITRN